MVDIRSRDRKINPAHHLGHEKTWQKAQYLDGVEAGIYPTSNRRP